MSRLARPTEFAGSWYPSGVKELEAKLISLAQGAGPMKKGARVIIGPHAGYDYCGSVLAQSYHAWDTSKVKTVFIFSPSHYVYFSGARVSKYKYYSTPFDRIPVAHELIKDLVAKNPRDVKYMNRETDDGEHGIELHLPMLYHVTKDLPQGLPLLVPILISSSDEQFEKRIAGIISQYIDNEECSFIVSSDFCHWGDRFSYTAYTPDESVTTVKELLRDNSRSLEVPIYKSIEYLDRKAMDIASTGSYSGWREYIEDTGNTICGQKPIAIILAALEKSVKENQTSQEMGFKWLGYKQSNRAKKYSDASVSYASGYVILD